MSKRILIHHKGTTRDNYTINCKINDQKNSTYDPSWANAVDTVIKIYEESDDSTPILTISTPDIVNITTSTITFKKSSIDSIAEGHYIAKVIPGDGTDTEEGEFELKVTE